MGLSGLPASKRSLFWVNQGFIKSSIDFDWKGGPPILDSSMLLAGKVQSIWLLASTGVNISRPTNDSPYFANLIRDVLALPTAVDFNPAFANFTRGVPPRLAE